MTKIEQIYRSFINVGFARTLAVEAVGSAIATLHLMSQGSDPQPDIIELERCYREIGESRQVAERASPKQSSPPLICASGVAEARVLKFGFNYAKGSYSHGYTIGDQAGEEITVPRGHKLTIDLTDEGELTVSRGYSDSDVPIQRRDAAEAFDPPINIRGNGRGTFYTVKGLPPDVEIVGTVSYVDWP